MKTFYLAILSVSLLAGCNPPAPSEESIQTAIKACQDAGGKFEYYHGVTVRMTCKDKKIKPKE